MAAAERGGEFSSGRQGNGDDAVVRRGRKEGDDRPAAFSNISFSASPSGAVAMGAPVLCGRGDKKTKKGKIFKGPYGNARPKKEKMIERIKDKGQRKPLLQSNNLYLVKEAEQIGSGKSLQDVGFERLNHPLDFAA
ncbi:putative 30S ribosomal protein S31, mitochondrial precursor [Corchorus capsularis]|uniref:Putative 30S ribosomal protein S31, mitochondrial n=1 Tax=Corchorus capsularis TaxID=210143 RepID=A0A1R3GT96_COCAP|nr:putative 30S ribosomal protein S31, mitochondrial precursor [Corchorus capsularis]